MRHPGRLPASPLRRRFAGLARLVATAAWLAGLTALAAAGDVAIRGATQKGFVRIELKFQRPTKVTVRGTNGVVVVGFGAPTRITAERLAVELPAQVAVVRRDPDETGFRIALVAAVRTNVLEAGERVFIDLLPPNWSGLPPALPPEVVAELAARAEAAEERLREEARRRPPRAPVKVRVAELPSLTRLILEPPDGTQVQLKRSGPVVEAELQGYLALDLGEARPKVAAGVAGFDGVEGETSLTVRVAAAAGYEPNGFAEDGTVVVDLAKPGARAAELPDPKPEPAAFTPGHDAPPTAPAPAAAAAPPAAAPDPDPPAAAAPPPGPAGPPRAPQVVRPRFAAEAPDQGSVLFPFPTRPPAAAFLRGQRLTLVFDTLDRIDPAALAEAVGPLASLDEAKLDDGLAILRLRVPDGRAARLLADGEAGWRLAVGGPGGTPPDEILVSRTTDADGEPLVLASLPLAAAVHWLGDDPDGPVAVVTATGRPRGLSTGRRFVEFALRPSLHGLVVERFADDLAVGLGRGGAILSRRQGLTLSGVAASGEAPRALALVAARDPWLQDQAGDTLARYRELIAATAAAPRSGRGEARLRLARFMLANGLSREAASLLTLARADDAVFARRRDTLILSAIAAARSGRWKDVRQFLAGNSLAEDREAGLWRAAADAHERDWPKAVAGFRAVGPLLDHYPDELAGMLRMVSLRAALAASDLAAADTAMAAIDRLGPEAIGRDEHDLARALLDEASGRPEGAARIYERLTEDASRPIQAEATLRGTVMESRAGRLAPEEALRRLEVLAVAWRGDEIELGTLVELARIYAAAGRWRDVFAVTRRADTSFPLYEATRRLHDDTARRFEELVLGNGSAVEILALYYDFREFAPVGRRGDEIVRRLADRLVELDLLDQAGELLQHQVDKRLSGTARAAVAARLAAIRLIGGKPAQALQVLAATRLAELPAGLRRFRLLLEAEAQAELTRVDLALEIVEGEDGVDFSRLRAGILLGASRWMEAGEAFEKLAGTAWQRKGALSDAERADVIRAAVADVMADERIALDRLRGKFAAQMADSPDAKTFELLMQPDVVRRREFRAVLRDAGRAPALRQLLVDWAGRSIDADERAERKSSPGPG